MNLLLDTHIFIWSLLEPQKLGKRAAEQLADPDNALWLSPISSWEIMLLVEKGRLRLQMEPHAWVELGARSLGLREAPLTLEAVSRVRALQLPHGDPADRLIAATALAYNLTLVTADQRLLGLRKLPTLRGR